MPRRNGAVARGSAPPTARTLRVRAPRHPEDAAHVSDGGIPAALTQRRPDLEPLVEPAGPARDSTGASQLPAPVLAPDR